LVQGGNDVRELQNPEIQMFETSRSDLEPQPIEPSWIKEGTPIARATTLSASPDGTLTAGLWDCTAGTFRWIYSVDEIVHILEGEVRVSDGTRTQVLVPGSVAYFPCGLEAVWEVPKYVKKMFILRGIKRSLPQRILAILARRLLERMQGQPE
jgi:uncharacterized cupin superfamily protein